jgi:chromosomal replication initiation ATPase DnaA
MTTIEHYSNKIEIPVDALLGKSRKFQVSLAREIYWQYLRKNRFTYKKIAQTFDRRQHSTISSGIKTAENLLSTKEKWALSCMEALSMSSDENF